MGDADVIDVVSRADAKAIGLSKYFTGEPCLRGHISTRNTKSGRCHACSQEDKKNNREAVNEWQREYRRRDPEKANERDTAWRARNLERAREVGRNSYRRNADARREYARAYHSQPHVKERRKAYAAQNKDRLDALRRESIRRRLRSDVAFRLNNIIRARIWHALRGNGGRRTEEIVGYTMRELIVHLERQFLRGMSWENYGSAWHIDHIIPLASFSFTSQDDPDLKVAWGLPNLRPLWAEDNLAKRDRVESLL
jgi:hypothetical protein